MGEFLDFDEARRRELARRRALEEKEAARRAAERAEMDRRQAAADAAAARKRSADAARQAEINRSIARRAALHKAFSAVLREYEGQATGAGLPVSVLAGDEVFVVKAASREAVFAMRDECLRCAYPDSDDAFIEVSLADGRLRMRMVHDVVVTVRHEHAYWGFESTGDYPRQIKKVKVDLEKVPEFNVLRNWTPCDVSALAGVVNVLLFGDGPDGDVLPRDVTKRVRRVYRRSDLHPGTIPAIGCGVAVALPFLLCLGVCSGAFSGGL